MNEQWKWIRGFRGRYKFSNRLRVKSVKRKIIQTNGKAYTVRSRIMKPHLNKLGYWQIILYKNGKAKIRFLHHLVLEFFVGLRPSGKECRHLDGNPSNYHPTNLKWGTKRRNEKDKVKHGTKIKGERVNTAKLTKRDVFKIRKLYKSGKWFQKQLGKRFGVSGNSIWNIINFKTWKCL